MIVLDTSTLVGAVINLESVPGQAVQTAFIVDKVAFSGPTMSEFIEVLTRPRLARFLDVNSRDHLLALFTKDAVLFSTPFAVTDCRDLKDNKYLELALASQAEIVISSDNDLLVLDPWRGIRILRPAEFLARARSPKFPL